MKFWHNPRQLNALALLCCLLAALGVIAQSWKWLTHRAVFNVTHIRVLPAAGESLPHINAPTVRAEALPRLQNLDASFFALDLEAVKTAFEALPWVARAQVRRVFPNRLNVILHEHQALALWSNAPATNAPNTSDARLLSLKGEVFNVNLAESDDDEILPELAGPPGSEKMLAKRFVDFNVWLAPLLTYFKTDIAQLTLSARYAWSLQLGNGLHVEFGREQDDNTLSTRAARLVAALPELSKQYAISGVDLRYANGLAIHFKSAGQAQAQVSAHMPLHVPLLAFSNYSAGDQKNAVMPKNHARAVFRHDIENYNLSFRDKPTIHRNLISAPLHASLSLLAAGVSRASTSLLNQNHYA